MSDPFFSIIIPAYNTAHYLPVCIDSLLTQSFGDFEIILVDDASTDGTGELADQMASRDGRIHVFHISHGGASAARNMGLTAASGEYVLFMDSDDMLVPDGLERIKAKLHDRPDLLWFGFLYRKEDGSQQEGKKLRDTCYANASEAAVNWIQNNMLPVSACSKVFRLSVIQEFGIQFRENVSFGEDRLFNLDYLKHCGTIVTSSDHLYIYIVRSGSASHRFVPGMLSILLALHEERLSALQPLCAGILSDKEQQAFFEIKYEKSLRSAWLHLAEYYPSMTKEERTQELEPYLNLRLHKGINRKALGRRTCLWFLALNIAVRFQSLLILKLMMSVNRLISGKANT